MELPILVVDDHPSTRALFARFLALAGFAVQEAADGLEALAAVARARPALVVSDIRMPGVDGAELARRLMAHDPPVPVVLTSSDHAADPRLPGVPFLPKPVDLDDLRAAVARLLTAR
ncbi:MAG: two-component system, OmpR family, response regulator MprA [Thermomicrobiales bacterium]|jgi:CheY-like chemotaxis protein|nr:two-component system, OmpR family, response regulator MprA [Thermomicrobiales bacterium]